MTPDLQSQKLTARLAVLIVVGGAALSVGGCGAMIADLPLVGLPADAPPRKPGSSYMPVNDLPGARDTVKMETAEQARIRTELATEREKQATAAAAAAAAAAAVK